MDFGLINSIFGDLGVLKLLVIHLLVQILSVCNGRPQGWCEDEVVVSKDTALSS